MSQPSTRHSAPPSIRIASADVWRTTDVRTVMPRQSLNDRARQREYSKRKPSKVTSSWLPLLAAVSASNALTVPLVIFDVSVIDGTFA